MSFYISTLNHTLWLLVRIALMRQFLQVAMVYVFKGNRKHSCLIITITPPYLEL